MLAPVCIQLREKFSCFMGFPKRWKKYMHLALFTIGLALFHIYLVFASLRQLEPVLPLIAFAAIIWLVILYNLSRRYATAVIPQSLQDQFKQCFMTCWSNQFCNRTLSVAALAVPVIFLVVTAFMSVHNRWQRINSLFGFLVIVFVLLASCKRPSEVRWRPVIWGFSVQVCFGLLTLKWSEGQRAIQWVSDQIITFLSFADQGSEFVYGFLAKPPRICGMEPVLMFSALQTVLYFSSISSLLYHLGLLQLVFAGMAKILQLTLATTAIESFHAVVSIFLGMCESAIIVSPYLARQTESELFAILCSGFASSSVAMFSVYSMFGACPQYLVASSLMSAPASLACSKLALPETEPSTTRNSNFKLDKRQVELSIIRSQVNPHENLLDAISAGATNALKIILEMGANLVVFVALLALTNSCIRWLGDLVGILDLSLESSILALEETLLNYCDIECTCTYKENKWHHGALFLTNDKLTVKRVQNGMIENEKIKEFNLNEIRRFKLKKKIFRINLHPDRTNDNNLREFLTLRLVFNTRLLHLRFPQDSNAAAALLEKYWDLIKPANLRSIVHILKKTLTLSLLNPVASNCLNGETVAWKQPAPGKQQVDLPRSASRTVQLSALLSNNLAVGLES
ncbi:hypothetical protein M513_03168 [Trichuris suis]|uniref:Sodium/nucleoside cotransporter 2 n=1 Tax=Trichuris suis TaxID=68888 RepID=A0A085MFP8_9BILA|nr:hypothetical protein M513_03168 [Trichuris suis]